MKKHLLLMLMVVFGLFGLNAQTTRYVKEGGAGDSTGVSWGKASNDLQAMINASNDGDIIYVAKGTYKPNRKANAYLTTGATDSTNKDNAFVLRKGVKIYGGFNPDEGITEFNQRNWIQHETKLSGLLPKGTGNVYHVVIAVNNLGDACLDGFIITQGNAAGATGTPLEIQGTNVKPVRENGGGIYIHGANAELVFENLNITGNNSLNYGAGIFINSSVSKFINTIISTNNTTSTSKGFGAGVYIDDAASTPVFTNVKIQDNTATATAGGGGVYVNAGSPVFTNVLIENNKNRATNLAAKAAGIYVNTGSPTFTNVTIANNSCPSLTSTSATPGIYINAGTTKINNCIVWGNKNKNGVDDNIKTGILGTPSYSYSLVGGGSLTATGIISNTNPLFVSATDYSLTGFSPCLNAGDNTLYDGIKYGDKDLTGNPRTFSEKIDLGAYEYQKTSITTTVLPLDGVTGVMPTDEISIQFNVDIAGFDSEKITIIPDVGGMTFTNNAGKLTIIPNNALSYADDYTVTIAEGAITLDGYSETSPKYTSSFATDRGGLTTWYVAPEGTGRGESWVNASNDLQEMINRAVAGDEIYVAAGTYKPNRPANSVYDLSTPNNRNNAFVLKEGVKIYGGFTSDGNTAFADRNWQANPTILSGDIGVIDNIADNSYHVVVASSVGSTTVLDGFAITGATGNTTGTISVNNNAIIANKGGGITNALSLAVYTNLIIVNNIVSNSGAGIYNNASSPLLTNVVISDNMSTSISESSGAGMSNDNLSSPILTNVTITKNSNSNKYTLAGAGIYNLSNSNPQIRNSIIWGNKNGTAVDNIYDYESIPVYANCLVEGGTVEGTTIISNADPLFVGTNDFRLQNGSPAIDKGDASFVTGIVKDLYASDRILGTTVDLGAYEYVAATGVAVAPTAVINGRDTMTLYATIQPANASDSKVIWSSSDEAIATVDPNTGLVKVFATTASSVTITATTKVGGFTKNCLVTINALPLNDIQFVKTEDIVYITGANTASLPYTYLPLTASNTTVTWTISPAGIASIDPVTGEITPESVGSATITATATDGSAVKAEYALNVYNATTSISINGINNAADTMYVGTNKILTATVLENTANQQVIWTSSNTSVATINAATGEIVPIAFGTTTITATAPDNNAISDNYSLQVYQPTTAISINTVDSAYLGGQKQLVAVAAPVGQTYPYLQWTSSTETVATVDENGLVTPILQGITNISVSALDGTGITVPCELRVFDISTSLTINVVGTDDTAYVGINKPVYTVTVEPLEAAQTVIWTSTNSSIAEIVNGQIVSKAFGTTIITATAIDGNSSASYTLHVYQPVKSITLTAKDTMYEADVAKQYIATVAPAGEVNLDKLNWINSNETVATIIVIDETTVEVTPVTAGTTNITISANDGGGKSATCVLTVFAYSTGVTFASTADTIYHPVYDAPTLLATVEPATANQNVTWSSSNEAIAVVTETGIITTLGLGEVTIKAASVENPSNEGSYTLKIYQKTATLTVKPTDTAYVGAPKQISYTRAPGLSAGINPDEQWTSSNTAVATVDATGLVTLLAPGETNITIAVDGGRKTATSALRVFDLVDNITMDATKTIYMETTGNTISYTVSPATANQNIEWKSSNETVATVDKYTGVITPITQAVEGTVIITATTTDGTNKEASCVVYVLPKYPVTSVSIDEEVQLAIGDTMTLVATIAPELAFDKTITWKSLDETIATVSNTGIITAKMLGTAKIAVTSNSDATKADTCLVTVAPTIRYVKEGGTTVPTGAANYKNALYARTWETACADLQAVINISNEGDTIFVQKGTYYPNRKIDALDVIVLNNRDNSFVLKKGVKIFGGFEGTEAKEYDLSLRNFTTNETTLSGDLGTTGTVTDNAYHVVVVNKAMDENTCLDGFTITGGNANGTNTLISINRTQGGGMLFYSAGEGLLLKDLIIKGNTSSNYGGGILITSGSSVNIENCEIRDNTASSHGGGIYILSLGNSKPMIINSIISGNITAKSGGGIFTNYLITVVNTLIENNTAAENGGGINFEGNGPKGSSFTNVTIVNNKATGTNAKGGGVLNPNNIEVRYTNTIIWGNNAATDKNMTFSVFTNKDLIFNSCLIEGFDMKRYPSCLDGTSVTLDPLFDANYKLSPLSPCVDRGDNTAFIESYGTKDLAGEKRIFNDVKIDMGAYESTGFIAYTPTQPATNVDLNTTTVSIEFEETLSDLKPEDITITPNPGGINAVVLDGKKIVINHEALKNDNIYTVTVKAGAVTVGGIVTTSDYNWRFSTPVTIEPIRETPGILYVTEKGTGNGEGSWANASNDLQAVFNKSIDGDTIFVAKGIYYPNRPGNDLISIDSNSQLNTFVVTKDVKIFGGFAEDGVDATLENRNWETNVTTLSGAIPNYAPALHVVTFIKVPNSACLDGFTITGGKASKDGILTINDISVANNIGGGICSYASSPLLTNLVVIENEAKFGSGIALMNGSDSKITNVTVKDNTTDITSSLGAGIYSNSSNPVIADVIVQGNQVKSNGGGIYLEKSDAVLENLTIGSNTGAYGGGLYATGSDFTLKNSTIESNTGTNGGGLYLTATSKGAIVQDVIITKNIGTNGGGLGVNDTAFFSNIIVSKNTGTNGGGIYIGGGSSTFENVTVIEDTATTSGGGMYINASSPILTNMVIKGNVAKGTALTAGGGGIYITGASTPVITNVVLTENLAGDKPAIGPGLGYGGAIYNADKVVAVLTNVTISNNKAKNGGGMYSTGPACKPSMRNSIIWANDTIDGTVGNSNVFNDTTKNKIPAPIFEYNLVQGLAVTGTNIDTTGVTTEQVFPNIATGDYHSGAAVLNKGDNAYYDAANIPDLSAITTDLDGHKRINYSKIDLGAYEYTEATTVTLDKTRIVINTNTNASLTATIEPSYIADKDVKWTVADESIISIQEVSGTSINITPKVPGITVITAISNDGGLTAECTVEVKAVPVETVTVTPEKALLVKGNTLPLTVAITPETPTSSAIKWISTDESLVTVNSQGLVEVIGEEGVAYIIAIAEDNGTVKDTCEVTVFVPVHEVVMNSRTMRIPVNAVEQLTATVNPENATNREKIEWTSSSDLVTVDNTGKITANAATEGEATITATINDLDGNVYTDVCVVAVFVPVDSIVMDFKAIGLKITPTKAIETKQLTVTFYPETASEAEKALVWTIDNSAVATVSETGLVTAVGSGTTVIRVKTADNKYADTCLVTVTDLGIANTENANNIAIVLYPNPVKDVLYINTSEKIEGIVVYDINGRKVKQFSKVEESISIADLAQGVYVVKIQTKKGEFVKQIIKK